MLLKIKALASGLATYLPQRDLAGETGGTDSARYCYSVWLRHLRGAHASGRMLRHPRAVAELGPGDSIGIGLAALLSGVERYLALDVVRYSDLAGSQQIFEELVALFEARAPIPGDDELPGVYPKLRSYEFPRDLLGEAHLQAALEPARVRSIRESLEDLDAPCGRIRYLAPWTDDEAIAEGSIDLIYSQAVLEHVDDLPQVYRSMRRWVGVTGVMSHQIDYRCHGKADEWNGHWSYSDAAWRIVVGRRPYLLNRAPHSEHVRLLRESGFDLAAVDLQRAAALPRSRLARRFRDLSNEDLTTCGAYIVAAPC
jgi:SAM-dependent methyltransferase